MADPVSLIVMVAIAAAASAASYTLNYFLTPKPKGQERGRLQGELQVQDSVYGSMIPLVYGGDPDITAGVGGDSGAVVWQHVHVWDDTANDITRPVGIPDAYDARAESEQTITAHEEYFSFIVGEEGGEQIVGLSPQTNTPPSGGAYDTDEMVYWIHFSPVGATTNYRIFREDGTQLLAGGYEEGNEFRIGIDADGHPYVEHPAAIGPDRVNTDATYTFSTPLRLVAISGRDNFIIDHTAEPSVLDAEFHGIGAVEVIGGGGTTIAGNVIYLSPVRAVVTETPAEGGKGGPSAPPTKDITYYCDIGIKFCEGRQLLQKLYADAEPLLDFASGTTGLTNPDADPEPDYDNLTPIDPSDPDVALRREVRHGMGASYDSNGVLSGTLKDGSTFRFYQGTDTQPADPLYQTYFQGMFPAQHTAGKVVTPTHKGDCLLFIQNFNVSNFGRIPSIRAKLSNADLYEAGTIIDDLAQRVGLESADLDLTEIENLPVRGLPVFDRNGATDAIATLQLIHAFDLVDSDGALEAVLRGGAVAGTVDYDDLGSSDGNGEQENSEQPVRSESEINVDLTALPARLDLSYLSAVTDGESETVGFSRLETDAKVQEAQELNAVLRKDEGERVMRRLLDTLWSEARATRRFTVPHTYYQIKPGRAWNVPVSETSSERVRVTEVNGFLPGTFECKGVVESSRSHTQTQIAVSGSASSASGIVDGHSGAPPTVNVPNTSVATFIDRLLRDRERQDGRPGYYVGARGFSADPWGGCTIKRDRGAGFERVIDLTEPATLGVIAVTPATLLTSSTMDVDLYEGGTLPSFTAGEVTGGQGYVIAGALVFQYQTATQLSTSPNRWQLSDISNIGAECSTNGSLAAGQRFALLNQAFRFVAIESEEIGVERDYIAQSSGQAEADCARIAFTCEAPNLAVTTPADWSMTPGNAEITHNFTPFSDACVMSGNLIYEIRDDSAGSPGALLFSGNSVPIRETGLAAGTYTRHFRVRSAFADGEYLTDSVVVTDSTIISANPAGQIEDFIKNFYQGALDRQPTSGELAVEFDLIDPLFGLSWYTAAKQIGNRLFSSAEYIARGRTDAQFVSDCYQAYLARAGDPAGVTYWLGQLATQTRAEVAASFGDSVEFRLRSFNIYGWRPENHWEPLTEPTEELLFEGDEILMEETAS